MSVSREFDPGEERELGFRLPEDTLTDDEQEAAGGHPGHGTADPRAGGDDAAGVRRGPRAGAGRDATVDPAGMVPPATRHGLTVIAPLPDAAVYALSAGLTERFADVSDDPSRLAHALAAGVPALVLSRDPGRQETAAHDLLARAEGGRPAALW
jgi:hypothetical protein